MSKANPVSSRPMRLPWHHSSRSPRRRRPIHPTRAALSRGVLVTDLVTAPSPSREVHRLPALQHALKEICCSVDELGVDGLWTQVTNDPTCAQDVRPELQMRMRRHVFNVLSIRFLKFGEHEARCGRIGHETDYIEQVRRFLDSGAVDGSLQLHRNEWAGTRDERDGLCLVNGWPGIAAKTRQIDGGGNNVHRCSRVQCPLMGHRLKSSRGIGEVSIEVVVSLS